MSLSYLKEFLDLGIRKRISDKKLSIKTKKQIHDWRSKNISNIEGNNIDLLFKVSKSSD